jgi:hypothetical protein
MSESWLSLSDWGQYSVLFHRLWVSTYLKYMHYICVLGYYLLSIGAYGPHLLCTWYLNKKETKIPVLMGNSWFIRWAYCLWLTNTLGQKRTIFYFSKYENYACSLEERALEKSTKKKVGESLEQVVASMKSSSLHQSHCESSQWELVKDIWTVM